MPYATEAGSAHPGRSHVRRTSENYCSAPTAEWNPPATNAVRNSARIDPVSGPGVSRRAWRAIDRHLPALLIVTGIGLLSVVNQRSGHDWGDDFALYLRQSQALVEGNVGEVLTMNRFTVEESSWSTFSPGAYPWGTPLLLAPVVAVWGIDYPMLKLAETVLFACFLFTFYVLAARRTSQVAGLALMALIGLSVSYVGWTDTVLSEFPYLAFVTGSLWWIDRIRDRDAWRSEPVQPLVVCGLLIGFAYSIRREAIALVVALVAAQVVDTWRQRRAVPPGERPTVSWRRLAAPHLSAAAFVVGLQLVLPAVLLQRYPGTGLHQLGPNLAWFRDILAEQIGLKDPGVSSWDYLASPLVARSLFVLFVVLAVVGLVVRLWSHLADDITLGAYLIAVALVVGVLPFHEGRYLFSITPLLAYFAYQGIATPLRRVVGARRSARTAAVPGLVALGFLLLFVLGNATDLYRRTSNRLEAGDYPHWGPEHPAALEMFDVVRERTRRDEVLAFFRARAMNLYSDRQTLQLTSLASILERVDWYVMAKDSEYSQVLVTPQEAAEAGLELIWENDRFVLWRVPDR